MIPWALSAPCDESVLVVAEVTGRRCRSMWSDHRPLSRCHRPSSWRACTWRACGPPRRQPLVSSTGPRSSIVTRSKAAASTLAVSGTYRGSKKLLDRDLVISRTHHTGQRCRTVCSCAPGSPSAVALGGSAGRSPTRTLVAAGFASPQGFLDAPVLDDGPGRSCPPLISLRPDPHEPAFRQFAARVVLGTFTGSRGLCRGGRVVAPRLWRCGR